MADIVRTPYRLAFVLAIFLLLTAISIFMWSRVEASTSTLGVQSARIAVGQTATLHIVLSEAPNGLAGLDIVVTLSDPRVASIVGAELAEYGLTSVEQTSASEVRFRAVDIAGTVEAGAVDVTLATLTVHGDKNGSTDVLIDVIRLDDEDGNPIFPDVLSGAVGVKKNVGGKGGGGDKGGKGKGKGRNR